MNKHRSCIILAVISALALIWTACSRSPSDSAQEVVVYTSEDQVFSEPILKDFEKETIEIDGQVVAGEGKNVQEPEKRNLGMVFQDLALWPHLTVKGNLEFGLKAQGMPPRQRIQEIVKMLRLVQLETYIDAKPSQLSGGQQQRVALGRALILHPQALLMDEPLSSLDMELSLQLRKEILRLQGKIGFTLLYVTHNHQEAFEIGTRIVVMSQGKVERIRAVSS